MRFITTNVILICTFILCGTLFYGFPLTTFAQTVNVVPDPNLRAAINESRDKAADAPITRDEMAHLDYLPVQNRGIRDLTGLEHAIHLRYLHFDENLISDLTPLAGCVSLKELRAANNRISDLSPLQNLVKLDRLRLEHNLVSDLSPIAGLVELRNLRLTGNLLADLSHLSELKELERFESWGTPIVNLSGLADLPKLRWINICGGGISDISVLVGLTTLRGLYLAGNEISDISALANLTNLWELNLEDNEHISDVSPLASLDKLAWLRLKECGVSDVSPLSTLALKSLKSLDLQDNEITDPSPLAVLPALTWVNLKNNPISDVSSFERFSPNTIISFSVETDETDIPEAGPRIEGPWLWALVPTRFSNTDFVWLEAPLGNEDLLAAASGGDVTEVQIATFGATEGASVGDSEWRAHRLSPTGANLREMADALDWGSESDIQNHVIYGSIRFSSPRRQETTMIVGSDDAVKVWFNGEMVYYNPSIREAHHHQEAFSVTLKQGPNVLLVAVESNPSGFFSFVRDAAYGVHPPGRNVPIDVPAWDVNMDGETNILDLVIVGQDIAKARPTNPRTDVNKDGRWNVADLVLVANHLNELSGVSAAPSVLAITDMELAPVMLREWLVQAEAADDGSLVFRQGIANLKRLLAVLPPEETALLTNYPNPFNPETWIPYQLATEAEVQIHIYDINGTLVRALDLGHQQPGHYQERDRAAYWDGRNALQESVASGLYFYTLTAGTFTATRKMLILK